jgi:glutamate dehydrogenase/leucine dehydrogenase
VLPITKEELLALEVDVMITAALENQITEKIAEKMRARFIVEGDNIVKTIKIKDLFP